MTEQAQGSDATKLSLYGSAGDTVKGFSGTKPSFGKSSGGPKTGELQAGDSHKMALAIAEAGPSSGGPKPVSISAQWQRSRLRSK